MNDNLKDEMFDYIKKCQMVKVIVLKIFMINFAKIKLKK